MKFTKITLSVALLGALTLGTADDATTTSVDSQIAAIKAAPAEERVQMMNEFKQKLGNMNQEDRMAAITQMQEKMQGKETFGSSTREQAYTAKDKGAEMGEMTEGKAHEMVQEKQMQANEQMSHMQNMNQMQAGNQYMHMNENGHESSNQSGGGTTGGSNYR